MATQRASLHPSQQPPKPQSTRSAGHYSLQPPKPSNPPPGLSSAASEGDLITTPHPRPLSQAIRASRALSRASAHPSPRASLPPPPQKPLESSPEPESQKNGGDGWKKVTTPQQSQPTQQKQAQASTQSNDIEFLKQKKESFSRVLKKLQASKTVSKDPNYAKTINEQIAALQGEIDKLDKEIDILKAQNASSHQNTAEALYDNSPEDPTELAFKAGDIITNVMVNSTEWWEGEIGGKRGYFPKSYVKLKQQSVSFMGTFKDALKWFDTKQVVKAVALFTFDAASDTELAFKEGDTIVVTNMNDDVWWTGEANGKTGYFPKDYVELANAVPPAKMPSTNNKVNVRVTYTYVPEEGEDIAHILDLNVGDVLEDVADAPEAEADWWLCDYNGVIGYYPKVCTEVIPDKLPEKSESAASTSTTSTGGKKKNFDFRMSIHILDKMKDFVSKQDKPADKPEKATPAAATPAPAPVAKTNGAAAAPTVVEVKPKEDGDVTAMQEELLSLRNMLQAFEQQMLQSNDEILFWKKKYEEMEKNNKVLSEKLAKLQQIFSSN